MKRKPRNSNYAYDRDYNRDRDRDYEDFATPEPAAPKRKNPLLAFGATSLAVLAGIFILGIGVGIGFYSVASNSTAGNQIDNSIQLESKLDDPQTCVQFGAAAIVMDTRVFVTLKPLNVYVSQPTTRPGCVLRSSNWSVLEQRGLVKGDQVRDCKNRLNTFGFTGALDNNGQTPQIDCIYQNDAAKNLFLNQPGSGGSIAPENEKF
ncbi:MAG TPA: DUF3172 domain-containing protein [Leptolyngbyaceae cyanobacterium M33_DOE_097]|uniref:DUF3172 domain-containing protein n=1 Tax=Oscillatoriales cyanobacterium SpSt-418 TaxID=2282169 RepID=A0A7C3PGA6_9CYAN|nr:DUF3172 domain-containing protein [Leptolyngbyaceae cyanobacterium M33_DOE_097]